MSKIIIEFKNEHRFLSNMYKIQPITIGAYTFFSSENIYMALKFMDHKIRKDISEMEPKKAKVWAKNKCRASFRNLRSDWNEIKVDVMEFALRHKFNLKDMREALLSTGDSELIEGNHWGDTFWGVDLRDSEHPGQNQLGRLLMTIREEIKLEPSVDLVKNFNTKNKNPQKGTVLVINRRKEIEDIYVGRGSGLGNPYSFKEIGNHAETISLYEHYFLNHVVGVKHSTGNAIVKKIKLWINNGWDVKIGCYCKKHTTSSAKYLDDSTPCHADIIKKYIDNQSL